MSLLIISIYVSGYDLGDITDTTSTDADVIIPAVYAAVQPSVNLALNKPAWSADNNTMLPPSLAVDGDDWTHAYIGTDSTWPFLAVDLGGRVMVQGIRLRVGNGECQV